ncbi:MAG: O-methyltransferase [Cyclobacteriaceae bacterium]|nr:O-methyltransferase [Cyclobacteriaceae bacterium]
MEELITRKLQKYLENHCSAEDDLLYRLRRETHLKVMHPHMISGPEQGRFLAFLSQMIQPKYILDIGTFTGYSALCLAKGLRNDGKLITIDINEEINDLAVRYFREAGFDNKIQKLTGDAAVLIPQISLCFDLVFIDADKIKYPVYYELALEKMKPGAFLLIDNVLWYGKVVEDDIRINDKETLILKKFNEMVQQDKRVENVIIPLRDGISIVRKL